MKIKYSAAFAMVALTACSNGNSPSANEVAANEAEAIPAAPASNVGASGAAETVAFANGRASRFSSLDEAACGKPETVAETGDWSRSCKGVDDIELKWSSGDLREDLAIVRGDSEAQLQIPVKVANGAFDSIAKTIEWRGPVGKAADVMVVRVGVANDQGENDGGHLTVVRVSGTPCIVAIVRPQSGQSEKARKIADGKLPACL